MHLSSSKLEKTIDFFSDLIFIFFFLALLTIPLISSLSRDLANILEFISLDSVFISISGKDSLIANKWAYKLLFLPSPLFMPESFLPFFKGYNSSGSNDILSSENGIFISLNFPSILIVAIDFSPVR